MFDESILYSEKFKALNTNSVSINKAFYDAGLVYPEFVTTDPKKNVYTIFWSEEFGFTCPDISETFDNIDEIYDFIETIPNSDADFDKSVEDSGQVKSSGFLGYSGTKKAGSGFHRLYMGPFDHEDYRLRSYVQFLRLAKAYIANPADIVIAYDFINHHPAFWYRWDENRPNEWDTENGHKSLWVWPHRGEDGKFYVAMEHGSSVEPEYRQHYHDFRLDVYGDSFEDAYIKMAAAIHKFFFLDGSERPDIPYEKSELELDLEERMASINLDDLDLDED